MAFQNKNGLRRWLLIGVSTAWLAGCNTPAIYNDPIFNPPVNWGYHTVQDDETLYRIAWQYGRDYRELAAANGIRPPFTIQEGQRINLGATGPASVVVADSKPDKKPEPAAKVFVDDPETRKSVPLETKKPKQTDKSVASIESLGPLSWQWPHSGQVLRSFTEKGMGIRGLEIAGSLGDPVHAAAPGRVVYAGSGILGYGNLIIIGHQKNMFSVYAHNNRLLAKEGDLVEKGQSIAEVGKTGTEKVKLYFEVRKGGRPVNPVTVLPGKG